MVEQAAKPKMPLVSVVIPTFNRPEYLRIALQSPISQTLGDLEIIVQDNASPVDPSGVVASFKDARIVYHRNPEHLSQTANVVSACAKARGKYLAILGDDDVWHSDFLATLVAPLERDISLTLAFCDHFMIDAAGREDRARSEKFTRKYYRHRLHEGVHRPFDEIALVYRSVCLFSAAVLRRTDIDWQSIPLELGYGPVDYYIAYLAARTAKGCYYVPQRLASYRYHAGALSSSRNRPSEKIATARYAMIYWRRLLRDSVLDHSSRYFQMKMGHNALVVVVNLMRCGDWQQGWQELRQHWAEGYISPRIFIDHVIYATRLHRLRA
jgi:glycosyltransferase involved in cell wall biosynthesis